MITDIINREIRVDDFVVFYSNIYQVKSLGKDMNRPNGAGQVKIMIWNGGHTAKPVTKNSKDIAVLDKNHVLLWQISQGGT
jgi:hypothetical protein